MGEVTYPRFSRKKRGGYSQSTRALALLVPQATKDALMEQARHEGRPDYEIALDAITRYLKRHRPKGVKPTPIRKKD